MDRTLYNCLTCARPYWVKILERPKDCFYAWTTAGELLGKVNSVCHDDCRLGGWIPSKYMKRTN